MDKKAYDLVLNSDTVNDVIYKIFEIELNNILRRHLDALIEEFYSYIVMCYIEKKEDTCFGSQLESIVYRLAIFWCRFLSSNCERAFILLEQGIRL